MAKKKYVLLGDALGESQHYPKSKSYPLGTAMYLQDKEYKTYGGDIFNTKPSTWQRKEAVRKYKKLLGF